MRQDEHNEQVKLFAWAEWERIDRPELGVVATVMGLDRALRNEGRPSVYEGRGLIVL